MLLRSIKNQCKLLPTICRAGRYNSATIQKVTAKEAKYDLLVGGESKSRIRQVPNEDAYFIANTPQYCAFGVADGVGQWRTVGYDPTLFPRALMENCRQLIEDHEYDNPSRILQASYNKIVEDRQVIGSATVCLLLLDKMTGILKTLTLGDSSFYIIRSGQILHTPAYQLHDRDAPYQLAIVPPASPSTTISSTISEAVPATFEVQVGDCIIAATDGLMDNLYDEDVIEEISNIHGIQDVAGIARVLCVRAHHMASRPDRIAPSHYRRVGPLEDDYDVEYGGVLDDVTAVVAIVAENQSRGI